MENNTHFFSILENSSSINTSMTFVEANPFAGVAKTAVSATSTSAMIIVMLAMGCNFDKQLLLKQLKRPVGIGICLLCQFIIFPLLCFGVVHVLQMDRYNSLGLMILSSSPGGTLSNLYCFWAGGDVTLSVSMTIISTAVAIGMMPLNLFVYGRTWESSGIKVPVLQIFIILILLSIPSAIGVLIKHKRPKIAKWITKIGSVVGITLIIITIIINVAAFPGMLRQSVKIYMISLVMPVFGFILGYNVAWLFRQPQHYRIAIAFEICFQSIGLSIAVISLSFTVENFAKLIFFCQLYGIFVNIDGLVFTALLRLHARYSTKKEESRSAEGEVDEPEKEALRDTGLTDITDTTINNGHKQL